MSTETSRSRTPLRVVPQPGSDTGPAHVVVVGGGMSGLSAAYALVTSGRPGLRVTVLEGSPVVGGKLRVSDLAGMPVDEGAESLLNARPEAVGLAREVGLGDDIVYPDTTSAALWNRGHLRPMPGGTVMGVPTDLRKVAAAQVLSLPSLLRLPLDHVLPGSTLTEDVGVGHYVAARLGREVVDRLVEPLLGGVYAGRADELSLQATMPALYREAQRERSVLTAARRTTSSGGRSAGARRGPVFAGIRGGVGRLPVAIEAALVAAGVDIRRDVPARELRRTATGWRIEYGDTRDQASLDADAVILATPAAPTARLLTRAAPSAATELAAVETASMAIVTLVYQAAQLQRPLVGSGFLVPPVEPRTIKASTFLGNKWGWVGAATAAEGLVMLRASVGRHRDEVVLQRDDDEIAALAHTDLVDAVGLAGTPVVTRVTRWGGALPQYAVGHVDRVARIRAVVADQPGLAVCGAAYDGVGIASVVGSARTAVTQVLDHLASRSQWSHG